MSQATPQDVLIQYNMVGQTLVSSGPNAYQNVYWSVFNTPDSTGQFSGYTNLVNIYVYQTIQISGGVALVIPTGPALGDLNNFYPNPTVVGLQGNPLQAQALSSMQDGYVLTWNDGYWLALPESGGFLVGGDLSGISGNQTIAKLQGNTLSASSPSTNDILAWNGSAWVPALVNLVNNVTGQLHLSNLIPGTPSQILLTSSSPAASWVTVTGDATLSSTGHINVIALQGNPVSGETLGSSQDGYSLVWQTSQWEAQLVQGGNDFVAAHDLSGSPTSQQVIGLNSVPIQSTSSSISDGYNLVTFGGQYIQQGNKGVINVRSFGAKGDGSTDDTAAIQAAIDYAVSLTPNAPDPTNFGPIGVYLPPGTYITSKPLFLYCDQATGAANGIEFFGEGGGEGNGFESGNGTIINNTSINNGVMPVLAIHADPLAGYPATNALEKFGNIWMWNLGYYVQYDNTQIILSNVDSADYSQLESLTFEAFVRPTVATMGYNWTIWASSGDSGNGIVTQAVNLFVYTADDGYNYAGVVFTTASGQVSFNGTVHLPTNTTTHVALVYNGSAVKLYVGGVLAGSASCSGKVIQSAFETVAIGAASDVWPAGGVPIIPAPIWLGGIRITNSIVYTSAFTPPTTEPVINPINVPDTLILINFDPAYTLTASGARDGWVIAQCSVCTIPADYPQPSRPSSGVPVWLRTYGNYIPYMKGTEVHNISFFSYGDCIYTDAVQFANIVHCFFQGVTNRGVTMANYSYSCNVENCSTQIDSLPASYPLPEIPGTVPGNVGNFFCWGVGQLAGAQYNTIKQHHHVGGGNWIFTAFFGDGIGIYDTYVITGALGSVYAANTSINCNNLNIFDEGSTACSISPLYFNSCENIVCSGCTVQTSNLNTPCVIFGAQNNLVDMSSTVFALSSVDSVAYTRFLQPAGSVAKVSGLDYALGYASNATPPLIDPAYSFGPLVVANWELFGTHVVNLTAPTGGVYTMNQNDFFWGTIEITDTNNVLTGKTNILLPTNVEGYKRTFINNTNQLLVIGGNLGVQTIAHPVGGCLQMVSNGIGWTLIDTGNIDPSLSAFGAGNWIGAVGGDIVTIYGVNMVPGSDLAFTANGIPMTNVMWTSDTTCIATAPAQTGVASPTSTFALDGYNGNGVAFTPGLITYNWDPSQASDVLVWYRVGQPNDGYTTVSGGNITKLLPLSASSGYNEPLYPTGANPAVYAQNAIGGRPAFLSPALSPSQLTTPSGSAAYVTVISTVVHVQGLTNIQSGDVGKQLLLISPSEGGTNDGMWTILTVVDSTHVIIIAPGAMTDSGGDTWQLNYATTIVQPFTVSGVVTYQANGILTDPPYSFPWFQSYTFGQFDLSPYIANTGTALAPVVYPGVGGGGPTGDDILGTVPIPNANWAQPLPGLTLSLDAIYNGTSSDGYFNNILSATGNLGTGGNIRNINWGVGVWKGYLGSLLITNTSISMSDQAALSLWRRVYYNCVG